MTTTDRLLACLDVCEESGLFDPGVLARERTYVSVMGTAPTIPVADCQPSVTIYMRRDGVHFSLGGTMPIDGAGVARYAAALTRVADVAAKCDAILKGTDQ